MSAPRRLLPVIQPTSTATRRGVLLLGAVAAGAAACRADADIGAGAGPSDDNDAGGNVDDDTGELPGDDTGVLPGDDADIPPEDSGVVTRPDVQTMRPDVQTTRPDVQTTPPDAATCSPGVRSLGNVSSFALGTWTVNTSARVIVGHDSGGLFAYSNVCTHQGCALTSVTSTTGAASCRCHGARFDGNGSVTLGPATQPLAHYEVTVCAGIAYVNTGRTVAASTRTPV